MEEEEIAGFDEEENIPINKNETVVEKPKSSSFLILVIIFLIIIAALAAFFIFTDKGRSLNPFLKNTNKTSNSSQTIKNNTTNSESTTETNRPKYTIDDAKKITSLKNYFTFYYPKTWFSENEIAAGIQKELYGYDSFFYFYPDNTSTDQMPYRTYFMVSASQAAVNDLRQDGSLANYTKTRIVEGRDGTIEQTRFYNTDAYKIVDDASADTSTGYFEGYVFVKNQLRYYRQRETVFLLGAHAKDKETFDKLRPEFDFMFAAFTLDVSAYGTSYKAPVLSGADQQRKDDIEQVADILDQYYYDKGEYPLYLTYEGLITKLQQDGYLDHSIQDPAWPAKGYHYGVICAEGVAYKAGTCYYRVDAEFDDSQQTMLKNDGGVDNSRYEVGSALGEDANKVQYME